MARIPEFRTTNPDFNRFVEILRGILEQLDLENFSTITFTGTTAGTADTQKLFKHNQNQIPQLVWPLEGDVYVAKNGRGDKDIDIRSRNASEQFTLILVF